MKDKKGQKRTKNDSFVFEGGLKTTNDSESPGRQLRTKTDKKGQKGTVLTLQGGYKVLITKSGRVDYEGQKRTKRDKKGQKRTVLTVRGSTKHQNTQKGCVGCEGQKGTKRYKEGQKGTDVPRPQALFFFCSKSGVSILTILAQNGL